MRTSGHEQDDGDYMAPRHLLHSLRPLPDCCRSTERGIWERREEDELRGFYDFLHD